MSQRFRWVLGLAIVAVGLSVALAACGSSKKKSSTTSAASGGTSTQASSGGGATSKCGLGNGKKATGTPIKLGAIATKLPGTDFTDIPNMTQAYFNCVNDNGGINGHPVQLVIETEQIDPGQDASLARKLIQSEKVVGIAGSSTIIECDVNHKYYEQQGFYVIGAGISPSCYATSNIAAVNMGPRYSSDGAAQYAIRAGSKKLVFDQSNVPGSGYNSGGVVLIAKDAGIPVTTLKENVPIQDANSVALKLVQAAGSDGGVVLNFTPPEAAKILQAAQQQGLTGRVKTWACSTPCNTDFLAKALGPAWNGKLGVNAELNLTSFNGPDSNLYRKILTQYGKKVTGGAGSFSQMGFTIGAIATKALLGIKGPYTVKSVNAAFLGVKDFKTDILCKPWYYGKAPLHIPNNTDRTVVPQDGKMVQKESCFPISDVDPAIAQVRKIEANQQ